LVRGSLYPTGKHHRKTPQEQEKRKKRSNAPLHHRKTPQEGLSTPQEQEKREKKPGVC